MYSEAKVRDRILLAEKELSAELDGGKLEYHAVEEVEGFEAYLKKNNMYVMSDRGEPIGLQNLSDFARRWMLNEQALCLCDAAYCLSRYAFVKDEKNVIRRFGFRVPQRILFDIISDLQDRNAAIEIIDMKSRQLGSTTVVVLLVGHRIFFSYGINAVLGSADEAMTGRMSQILYLFYDHMPLWMRPPTTRRSESGKGLLEFGSLSTGVSFQHGAQKHGIGTGTTPTLYLLSECALYEAIGGREKVISLIEEGLWNAVHPSPNVLGFLESTGRGDKGWWPDTWNYAKRHRDDGKSRMFPIFLPWFTGLEIKPTPTFIETRPIPYSWRPNEDTIQHVAKCELYVESEPLLRKHLLAEQRRGTIAWNKLSLDGQWRMPREQQWWWEVGHEAAKAKGTQGSWYQEQAADDVEALQRSGGEPVFGHEVIAEIDHRRQRTYRCWGLSGQSIESNHEPLTEYIDYSAERKQVRYTALSKKETYKWELIPMKFGSGPSCPHPSLDEESQDDPVGLLIEYEEPMPRTNYSIGVDTSEGQGEDSTAIQVWALGWDQSPDRQVAEFTSPYVSHTEAFSFILCIAAYYGQHMRLGETKWKEPYISIEQVRAVGDVAQMQMRRMGYSNFHRFTRYDVRNVAKLKKLSNKMGWFTFQWSRPILLGCFVHWVKNSWGEVQSPWLLYEMKHFERKMTGRGVEKWEHEDDEHDDRIMAAAMAVFCPHDMDRMDQRSKKRPTPDLEERQIDISPYPGTVFPAAALREKSVLTLDDLLYSSPKRYR